jgi:hypothetical protein
LWDVRGWMLPLVLWERFSARFLSEGNVYVCVRVVEWGLGCEFSVVQLDASDAEFVGAVVAGAQATCVYNAPEVGDFIVARWPGGVSSLRVPDILLNVKHEALMFEFVSKSHVDYYRYRS